MQGYWQFQTSFGTFRIVPRDGSFHPFFKDEEILGPIIRLRLRSTILSEITRSFHRMDSTPRLAACRMKYLDGRLFGPELRIALV
jgi:hypothetical protein